MFSGRSEFSEQQKAFSFVIIKQEKGREIIHKSAPCWFKTSDQGEQRWNPTASSCEVNPLQMGQ